MKKISHKFQTSRFKKKKFLRVKAMRKALETPNVAPTMMNPTKALALYKEMDIGKNAYIRMQQEAARHGAKIFPPYPVLLEAKKETHS